MERLIVLDNLIKYKLTEKIDWVQSSRNHCVINFTYGDTNGSFVLESYDNKKKACTVVYENKLYNLPTSSILKCNLRNLFITHTKNYATLTNQYQPNRNNDKREYYLYCHTNLLNNKKYYGITRTKPEYRWNHGKGYINNEYFYRAIQKYDWDKGFIHEILHNNLTELEASELEKYYIQKYNTTNRDCGYNIISGGIDEMSLDNNPNAVKIYQYSLDGTFIKCWDCIKSAVKDLGIENNGNISRALKIESHYAYGYLWYDCFYDKVQPYIGKKRIYQFDKDGNILKIYDSILNVDENIYNRDKVTSCCNHKSKLHHNNIWLFEDEIEYIGYYVRLRRYAKNGSKPIAQFTLDKEFIRYFVSIYEASDLLGFSSQSIYKNCIGEYNTANGFIWEYVDTDKLKPEVMKLPIRETDTDGVMIDEV